MSDQIQGPGLIPDVVINTITGALKSTDIPKANYCILRNGLVIEMFNTTIIYIDLPVDTGITDAFTITITEDKQMIPMPIFNASMIIERCRAYLQSFVTATVYTENIDIKSDPEFAGLLALKAEEGMKFYKVRGTKDGKLHTWFVPVFTGFPSLNKADGADIAILTSLIPGSAIVRYTIHKAKLKRPMYMYFRILELEE